MTVCASGHLCKEKVNAIADLLCASCEKPVHEVCAIVDTVGDDIQNYVCLACVENKKRQHIVQEEEQLAKRLKLDIAEANQKREAAAAAAASASAETTLTAEAAAFPVTVVKDGGREISIKQEQFEIPMLDVSHFSGLPDEMKKVEKRALDEPHPSLKSPVDPFKEGKASIATPWWLAFHHYNRDLPEYAEIRQDIICCNLCGAAVKRGERARATSALVQHLKTKLHKRVFDKLAVLWEGKARDPLVPRHVKQQSGAMAPPSQQQQRRNSKDDGGGAATTTSMVAPLSNRNKKEKSRAEKEQLRAITKWIVDTNQPLDTVETESFRHLVQVLQSTARYEPRATGKDVGREIVALDIEIKFKNREMLRGRKVWTTQGNTSGAETSSRSRYRLLTAHFINSSFETETIMLEAKEKNVAESKPHILASEYLEDIAAWGMTAGLQYALDRQEISNPGFVSSPELSSSILGAELEKDKNLLNAYFLDQQLASTAEVALDFVFVEDDATPTFPTTRQVLKKGRDLVALVKSSSQRISDLKQMQEDLPGEFKSQEPMTVIEDSAEFWWSVYYMVERLVKLRPALEKLWLQNRELEADMMLDSTEWDVLKQLMIALKPLILGVRALEEEKSSTASLALVALNMVRGELSNIRDICEGQKDDPNHEALVFAPTVSKCVNQLIGHFDETWGSLEAPFQGVITRVGGRPQKGLHWSIIMAYALDPRFKSLPHVLDEQNKQTIWDAIVREMAADKRATKLLDEADSGLKSNGNGRDSGKHGKDKEDTMMMYMMGSPSKEGWKSTGKGAGDEIDEEIKNACTSELSVYKATDSPPVTSNPLDWWRANSTRFPSLWSVAEVYMAMPVSAASIQKKYGVLEGNGDEPVLEKAKQRINIRCSVLPLETEGSASNPNDGAATLEKDSSGRHF